MPERNEHEDGPMIVTSTVRLRADVWRALRELAHRRAIASGQRTSASAIVSELVMQEAGRPAPAERTDA